MNTVECSFRPCVKLRSCGHPCTNVCGKDCNLGECGGCEEVRKKELQKMRHRYDKTLLLSIGGPLHSWLKLKKTRQKLDLKKREVDELGVWLQQFNTFLIVSSCNDRKRKSYEFERTCTEKVVKSHQGNLFLVGFSYLEPLCVGGSLWGYQWG